MYQDTATSATPDPVCEALRSNLIPCMDHKCTEQTFKNASKVWLSILATLIVHT